MGVRHHRQFIAWQLADAFKKEVIGIVRTSAAASRDFKYKGQVQSAATAVGSDIAEGFLRYSPGDFIRFLDYALGSLGEAEDRLADGIALGYFGASRCGAAFQLARRCLVAIVRLKQSQERYLNSDHSRNKRRR